MSSLDLHHLKSTPNHFDITTWQLACQEKQKFKRKYAAIRIQKAFRSFLQVKRLKQRRLFERKIQLYNKSIKEEALFIFDNLLLKPFIEQDVVGEVLPSLVQLRQRRFSKQLVSSNVQVYMILSDIVEEVLKDMVLQLVSDIRLEKVKRHFRGKKNLELVKDPNYFALDLIIEEVLRSDLRKWVVEVNQSIIQEHFLLNETNGAFIVILNEAIRQLIKTMVVEIWLDDIATEMMETVIQESFPSIVLSALNEVEGEMGKTLLKNEFEKEENDALNVVCENLMNRLCLDHLLHLYGSGFSDLASLTVTEKLLESIMFDICFERLLEITTWKEKHEEKNLVLQELFRSVSFDALTKSLISKLVQLRGTSSHSKRS